MLPKRRFWKVEQTLRTVFSEALFKYVSTPYGRLTIDELPTTVPKRPIEIVFDVVACSPDHDACEQRKLAIYTRPTSFRNGLIRAL